MDEEKLIEERRRRRMEILAKHKAAEQGVHANPWPSSLFVSFVYE
jgi:hypothetical protein